MHKKAYAAALCGVLGALAVAVMTLGTVIPVATFCCPALCGVLLIPVLDLFGTGEALCWYAAVGLLSLLLAPDKEAALIFLCLGYYPIVRPAFSRRKALQLPCKLLFFNTVIIALYACLLFLIGMPSVREEFADASRLLLGLLLVLGNVTFALYDVVLGRMTVLWRCKLKKKLIK